jgi:hypothetical protein
VSEIIKPIVCCAIFCAGRWSVYVARKIWELLIARCHSAHRRAKPEYVDGVCKWG